MKIKHDLLKATLAKPVPKFLNGAQYKYIDNGKHILAVAHLDTVQQSDHYYRVKFGGQWRVYSPKHDDRLGVYTILHHLPLLLGENTYDILLTTDEEYGMSTARLFTSGKRYKWIFQFDRAGTDAVVYQYDNPQWVSSLQSANWKIGRGSYSDISELSHLGACAVNIGVGYHNNHAIDAYMVEQEYYASIAKFVDFWKTYNKVRFEMVSDQCSNCDDPDCLGVHTCECCGINFHDDLTVFETGFCQNCWSKMT